MAVLFVIDRFNIDTEKSTVAETSLGSIEKLRQSINHNLKNEDTNLLRVRFNNLALFQHFKYFESLDGVLPTQHLIPRSVYRNKVDETLPSWLTDELIIQLDLLNKQENIITDLPLIDKVITSCHPDLLSPNFKTFTQALRQTTSFFLLLQIANIQAHFIQHFESEFNFSEDLSMLLMEHLAINSSVGDFFIAIAYEQHQELLRKQLAHFGIALLAETMPALLLDIPLLALSEQNAKELPKKCLMALERSFDEIEKGNMNANDITALIIAPWGIVLNKLRELVSKNSALISSELINQLNSFQEDNASELAIEFTEQLERSQFGELSQEATTDEVLEWSENYFEVIRQKFVSNQVVEEHLNLSFTNWMLKKSARIARSDADWRQFSKRIESFLEQDYLVVVCMVDALSALNNDLLLETTDSVEHLSRASETLFAPLPTLTEIGKMALITGTETYDLPSDQETAIRQRYENYLPEEQSLKFITSWKSSDKKITEKTNLLVFFENRIDERLHKCVEFENHRKDVSNILSQMKSDIDKWKAHAGSLKKDVVFLITADHGMTVTQTAYDGEEYGEVKERVFEVDKSYHNKNEDFSYISNGHKKAFLVPKKRVRLMDKALLSHGGLTPEEVLIPFVTLTSRQLASIKPLELTLLNKNCQRVAEKSWELSVELVANVRVENITIKFEVPFMGEETVTAIAENNTQKLLLSFSASVEQTGLREIPFQLTYDRKGAHEVNTIQRSCFFPEALLEKDSATQNYEDMFSL